MKALLDTDTCVELLRGNPKVVAQAEQISPKHLSVSVLTRYELLYGVLRCKPERQEREREKVILLLDNLLVIPFTRESADESARIRHQLSAKGQSIGAIDVLIAGTAIAENRELITHNLREFERIPELKCSSWNT